MNRFLYFAGFTYVALCGALVARKVVSSGTRVRTADTVAAVAQPPSTLPPKTGKEWFATMRPHCNPVEVDVRARYRPATTDAAAYAAVCYALAGKTDRAREIIEGMPPDDRPTAAYLLFDVVRPVAAQGAARETATMMELVLDYWPDSYMALYHAGMSEYSLGQTALAEKHLRRFLQLYTVEDALYWNAKETLEAMAGKGSGVRGPMPRAR